VRQATRDLLLLVLRGAVDLVAGEHRKRRKNEPTACERNQHQAAMKHI
jgi:hypothetical protein